MADEFIKRKFEWLDQVARDRGLSAEAFRLAYILASEYLNRATGDAWPGQVKLAETLGLSSTRSIKHLVDQLEERGHLRVTVGRGRGHSNRYAPVLQAAVGEISHEPAASLFSDLDEVTKPQAPEKPASVARTTKPDSEFDQWWLQFPRKVAKGQARRAYERIIRDGKASDRDLIVGAMRYAAERDGQDPKYTKHPATWLNAEGWNDETAPRAAPSLTHQASRNSTGAMSAIGGVADWLNGSGDEHERPADPIEN